MNKTDFEKLREALKPSEPDVNAVVEIVQKEIDLDNITPWFSEIANAILQDKDLTYAVHRFRAICFRQTPVENIWYSQAYIKYERGK